MLEWKPESGLGEAPGLHVSLAVWAAEVSVLDSQCFSPASGQRKKQRFREVKQQVPGHMTGKGCGRDWQLEIFCC